MNFIFKNTINSALLLKVIFVVTFSVFILIFSINYKHSSDTANASRLVMHSYKVQMDLKLIHFNINRAESNVRVYIITKDSSYIKNYFRYKSIIIKSLANLSQAISDNNAQIVHLRKLNNDALARLRFFEKIMDNETNTSVFNIRASKNLIEGIKLDKNIDDQIFQMTVLEDKLLKIRKKDFENKIYFSSYFTFSLLIFSILILISAYLKIKKDFTSLKVANQNMLVANQFMAHAEMIGDFGTWVWNLGNNEITYSDNIFNMLGIPPQSFEPNVQNFLDFVHPDEKESITKSANDVMLTGITSNEIFRIIRKDGEICYFNSLGKTIVDASGTKTILGITRNITTQYLISKSLEARNKELLAANTELENLNQVASHDLQEPLRKIQTFISRIPSQDLDLVSDSTKNYIQKISAATDRMRTLINDLLMFSQTTKSENFVETDLNILLQNALKELSIDITEKEVKVDAQILPIVHVIPFQIQQLFINLLQNAIKYSKTNTSTVVQITCDKINSEKSNSLKHGDPNVNYYKITFTDNGIGFDNEYATSIFSMFKRLHASDEYPGTGIGLAICKKIAENHSGKICAIGEVNVGAAFSIYLPT